MAAFFFDTHALVGITTARPGYERFRNEPIVTDRGCLYEFARFILKSRRARDVVPVLAALRAERLDPTDEDLVAAAKLQRQRPRLSAQDALGYVLARRAGLRFLTGDRAFRGMVGVQLVEE